MEKIGGRPTEFGKYITLRSWERYGGLSIDVGIRESRGNTR